MSISRKDVKEIIAIAKKHKGKIEWKGACLGKGCRPMKFRYIFVFQKTQVKCKYQFYLWKTWELMHIVDIPRGRKYSKAVNTSFQDTVCITQLLAHLRGIDK